MLFGIQMFYVDDVTGRTSCAFFSSEDEEKLKNHAESLKVFLGDRFKGYSKIVIKSI